MPEEIFVDSNADPGDVIRVGGQCYMRDGPSNEPATVFQGDIEANFDDCEACESSSSSSGGR
jgi:hypothetical protein